MNKSAVPVTRRAIRNTYRNTINLLNARWEFRKELYLVAGFFFGPARKGEDRMSEEDLGFEFQYTRPEMAYAVDTIFDTINILQSLKTPNKGKVKRIINRLKIV